MNRNLSALADFSGRFTKFVGVGSLALTVHAKDYYVDQANQRSRDYLTNGSREVPFKTIAAASRVAHAGDTVHVLPGVYREMLVPSHSGTEKMPIVFQAEGKGVWVKGSEVFGDWKFDSGYWVKRPWHPRFPYDADSMDKASNAPFQCSARMEQVFVDGKPLQWFPEKKMLEDGGFWWAPDGSEVALKLPVGMDPNHLLVEIPVREAVVAAWPDTDSPMTVAEATQNGKTLAGQGLPSIDWIVIRNFNFAHSIGLINRAGVRIQGEHWLLENNVVEWMNKTGIQSDNYAILKNNVTRFNGQSGYSAGNGQAVGVILDGNASLWDNTMLFNPGSCGAGLKCVRTRDFTVRNHFSLGAYGSGIWFDWQCSNTVIENCIVLANSDGASGKSHGGIFFEFSDGATIKNNIVFGNYKDTTNGPFGAGIMLSSTSNVDAAQNTLIFCQGGFGIVGGPVDDSHPFFAKNVSITDNLILGMMEFPFCFRLPSSFAANSNNHVEHNTVVASAPEAKNILNLKSFSGVSDPLEDSNGTLANNEYVEDFNSLPPARRATLSGAAGRILSALQRVGLFQEVMHPVNVEGVWRFKDTSSQALFLSVGTDRLLLVSNPSVANWTVAVSGKETVSVFHSANHQWQSVTITDGKLTCNAPAGLTIVTGLSADSMPD